VVSRAIVFKGVALDKNLVILRLIWRLVYEPLAESAKLDEKFSK
jgi:hypothetical protein